MGRDLSRRTRARQLREDFARRAEAQDVRLTFDFARARTLLGAFADELLAVLVAEKGEAWFREHVKLVNLTDELRTIVLNAIATRFDRQRPTVR